MNLLLSIIVVLAPIYLPCVISCLISCCRCCYRNYKYNNVYFLNRYWKNFKKMNEYIESVGDHINTLNMEYVDLNKEKDNLYMNMKKLENRPNTRYVVKKKIKLNNSIKENELEIENVKKRLIDLNSTYNEYIEDMEYCTNMLNNR